MVVKATELDEEAADQNHAGADAIDQKADRDLKDARHDVECDERETKLGVADAEILADDGKQCRQNHQIEMADEVHEADHADHAHIGSAHFC